MKKIFLALNLLLITAVCYGSYLYQVEGGLVVKGGTSAVFALLGLVNLLYAALRKLPLGVPAAMAAGLVLSMLGDILLSESFIVGAGLFALGHVCYFSAYCVLVKPKLWDFAVCALLFAAAAAFLLFHPQLVFHEPEKRWICLAYALIITLMMGKAVVNLIRKPGVLTAIAAAGSILFVFSDLMLVLDLFIGTFSMAGLLCMATYYPAQALLAASTYFGSKQLEEK